jgi:phosphatidyl-myo-inositol alpha-mannosyltransferase
MDKHTKNKNPSVTIGIPAYNEEANIMNLLNSLNFQKEESFFIEKIIVISDGSTDETSKIVKNTNNLKITFIDSKNREGKSKRLNQIFSLAKTDIVVILDADIKLSDDNVIRNLIKPLIIDNVAMSTSGNAIPLLPRTFAQKIAWAGTNIWDRIIRSKYASQLYLSEGRIRAFRKEVYQKMRFPESSADEAFSFLYCAKNNLPFVYVENSLVYYNLPDNLNDYIKQNKRFIKSKGIQESNYSTNFVEKYYTINWKIKILFLMKGILKNTFWTMLYLFTIPAIRMLCYLDKEDKEAKWDIILSSKKLDYCEEKKRIFFSSYDSIGNSYYRGGGAIAVHEVSRRLAKKYNVTVVCGTYPSAKKQIIDGVLYKHIGINYFGPKIGQLMYHFMLPYILMVSKFDLWIESFTPPFSTSFLQKYTKKPIIGLVHMLSAEDMLRKYKIPFYIIENLGIKTYNYFIVLTNNTFNKIKKINPHAHIKIIPNGVNMIPFKNRIDKKHFLFIGRIEINQKGLDLLLKAYKLIARKISFPLIIAGNRDNIESKKLVKIIKEFGLSEKVRLIGRVDDKQKADLFQNALAVIVPSRYETFSLVALETLSYRIPLIVFDIESLNWLPEKFCKKIKPFDINAMSQVISNISDNKNYFNFNENELREFLKKYDWDDIAKKYEEYINYAVNNK